MMGAWGDAFILASRRRAVRRAGLAAGICGLFAAAAIGGYWLPIQRSHAKLDAAVQQKRHEIIAATRDAAIARVYATTTKQVDAMERKLTVDNAQTALIHGLAELAAKYRIVIKSETFEEGKAQDMFVPLHCEINLQGSYPAVRRFLFGLQGLPTLTWIQEGSLASSESRAEIKVRLKLITYRRVAAVIEKHA